MKKILIFNAYYWPGFKSGGPQQSILNLVDTFGDKAHFYLITQNHDIQSADVYKEVKTDAWNKVGKAQVFYTSQAFSAFMPFRFLLEKTKGFDAVYLCDPYRAHSWKLLILKKLGFIHIPLYLAPMGNFSAGALRLKWFKKWVFWHVFDFLGLGREAIWSFTTEMEKSEARCVLSEKSVSHYIIAMDLPAKFRDFRPLRKDQFKKEGEAKLIFLSRVHPKKNLDYALDVLRSVKSKIQFDIYGPIEDKPYWERCQKTIQNLPKNIVCRYCGEVLPENVPTVFSSYDGFFFPTRGENFGHVIYESLLGDCIPILSDTTPWLDLEKVECGFVTPLACREEFVRKIEQIASLDNQEMLEFRARIYAYTKAFYEKLVETSGYKKLF